MNTLKYETRLKASGDDYKKIVFWNRFLRNPAELILSWVPALITIVLLALGYANTFLLIIYAICWFYPIYIFAFQFKSNVNYHLKHRDPSEDAPCTMTLMPNAILADIPDYELTYTYEWDQFTTAYLVNGYYMLFNGSKMIVMLNTKDMPEDIRNQAGKYIKEHVDRNKCKICF
ncbi:MAG: hypothetical protein ACI4D4_02020 [Lachnospira sp.]